jgi:hypothetical protein
LVDNGIEAEVLQTDAAVERFNKLDESVPVGGLFHSACWLKTQTRGPWMDKQQRLRLL